MSIKKKIKVSKTKMELYREKKKELNESIEYLKQVEVSESQGGGGKFIRDTRKEEKRIEKDEQDTIKTYLEMERDKRFTYRESLANYGFNRMLSQNFPDGWNYYCIPTDGSAINIFGKGYQTKEGILFILKSPKGNVYVRGIALVHDPEYDINAVNVMVVQVENTIDGERGILLSDNKDTASSLKRTKSGIILPN